MPEDAYDDLLALKQCLRDIPESREDLAEISRLTCLIRGRGDCVRLKDLAVTGDDLVTLGMRPGKAIGQALNMLLELVLEDREKNDRNTLLAELASSGCLCGADSKT